MFSLAAFSIASACSFISLVYWLISLVFWAISCTSSATDSVFSLMRDALSEISCIVADNSSVSADRSDTLSLEVWTLSRTSFTTPSSSLALELIIWKIFWSLPMKELIPVPTEATSWLTVMVTRLVRSPWRLSMPVMMSLISLFVFRSGRITSTTTAITAASNATILIRIVTALVASELRYAAVRLFL